MQGELPRLCAAEGTDSLAPSTGVRLDAAGREAHDGFARAVGTALKALIIPRPQRTGPRPFTPAVKDKDMNGGKAATVRAVALSGPCGAGKTSLLEAMLHAAGAIQRKGSVSPGQLGRRRQRGSAGEGALHRTQRRRLRLSRRPLCDPRLPRLGRFRLRGATRCFPAVDLTHRGGRSRSGTRRPAAAAAAPPRRARTPALHLHQQDRQGARQACAT